MATATYTCSDFNEVPRGGIPGVVSRSGTVAWTATSTVGDTAFLTKIPHGAVIVDFKEDHTTGASSQGIKFGLKRGYANGGAGNLSCLIASGAQATVNRMSVLGSSGGITVSVSDLDPLRYAELVATIASGTTTISLMINFTIQYRVTGAPD